MSQKVKISEFSTQSELSGSNYVPIVVYHTGSLVNRKTTMDSISEYVLGNSQNIGRPEMYGAVGDGVTDDWLAIKHALISHSVIEFSAKTYAVRGYIGVPSYRTIRGQGKDKTIIKLMDNSPYGYGEQLYIFQNTTFQNTIHWTGSAVGTTSGTGSVDLDHRDVDLIDQSPDSPLYLQPTSQNWAGIGLWSYSDKLKGARKDVVISDLTVDCNFDNQAKHVSWNHVDNPRSASNGGSGYYIPEYKWKVRPTVHAIALIGENIIVENVKIINYGYGVAYASAGPLAYNNAATYPVYIEDFPLILNGPVGINYTSSNTNDLIYDQSGNSKARGNYAIYCDVLDIANVDLMNPYSNATAIYVSNFGSSVDDSTFATDGGSFGCVVDPGDNLMPVEASSWNGTYLDSFVSASLKQTANNLFEWLIMSGSSTGSNGNYALSNGNPGGYSPYLKKISGSWLPAGNAYSLWKHAVNGYSGYSVKNCKARNCNIGFYLDSWRNNVYIEDNRFSEVGSAFRTMVTDIGLTVSYDKVVIKDNYVKLAPQNRPYLPGHSVIYYDVVSSTENNSNIRHINNLIIENNIFELPVSSSVPVYNLSGYPYTFREYPRYAGLWFGAETTPSGSYKYKHRAVSIKNNKFVNWNPLKTNTSTDGELVGYNLPIWFNYYTSSIAFDTQDNSAGPFPASVNKFTSTILPTYIIENNTYNDSIYPATASLVPLTYNIVGSGNSYYYTVDQVNRFDSISVKSIITNNLYSSSIYIGLRNDNRTGSGTLLDPYNGSTADAFDTILRNYRIAGSQSLDVNILPGVYQTRGNYDYFNHGGFIHTYGWSPLSNWRIRGSGVDITTLKHTGSATSIYSGSTYTTLESYVIHSYHFVPTVGIEVSDMTIDGNYSILSQSMASAYSSPINSNAVGLRGGSHYIHDIKVINVGSNCGVEGFPINIAAQHGGGIEDGDPISNWIENVEAYPISTIQGAGMTCIGMLSENSASTFHEGMSGYIQNCTVICESSSNHVQSFGCGGMEAYNIHGNVSYNAYNGIYADTFRAKSISITDNKLLRNQNMGIGWWGSQTSSVDPYAASNILIDGNVFEQKSSTTAIFTGYNTVNNYIITNNSFVTSGSGQTGISALSIVAESNSNKSSNIRFENNYIDTSSYLPIQTYYYSESLMATDYAIVHKNYVSGSLTLQSGSIICSGSLSNGLVAMTLGPYSHAEGNGTVAYGSYSHAEGLNTVAFGQFASHAEGINTVASASYSHTEGSGTISRGVFSHAEGDAAISFGNYSHAEGQSTIASGSHSHAEGSSTKASGAASHAEGWLTTASATNSHAEGASTWASQSDSHAEGGFTTSSGFFAHAEGYHTIASGWAAHSEGTASVAQANYSHVEGIGTLASGLYSHASGEQTTASGVASNTEGSHVVASGDYSKAIGWYTQATGFAAHAEGDNCMATGSKSHAEGYVSLALGTCAHAEGTNTVAYGLYSHAEGEGNSSVGDNSHAEGGASVSFGDHSHAEGQSTVASGSYSHAEGLSSISIGINSHAEGKQTFAGAQQSHAEGYNTSASAHSAHAEGYYTIAAGATSHAEGNYSLASEQGSHAEGNYTTASATWAHSEGGSTLASGVYSHSEGLSTTASGEASNSQGTHTLAVGNYSHAEGAATITSGVGSHAEGTASLASGDYSHAAGGFTTASGQYATSVGFKTQATGYISHAGGLFSVASGTTSEAVGDHTLSSGQSSRSEGVNTTASGDYSHAEGSGCVSIGDYSHTEGGSTIANGTAAHAEGWSTLANATAAHAEGNGTTASANYQHVSGHFNVTSTNPNDLFIIGNGISIGSRSNIVVVNTESVVVGGYISSSGTITPISSSLIPRITGSTYFEAGKFWIYTGVGASGWQFTVLV